MRDGPRRRGGKALWIEILIGGVLVGTAIMLGFGDLPQRDDLREALGRRARFLRSFRWSAEPESEGTMEEELIWQPEQPFAALRAEMGRAVQLRDREEQVLFGKIVGIGPWSLWLRYADGSIEKIDKEQIAGVYGAPER